MFNKIDTIYYEVNPYTVAVIGEKNEQGSVCSKIIELKKEFVIDQRPTLIIDQSCKYFGSSLRGRQEGTKEITGITHKAPIAIDPSSGIYMFPTNSPNKDTCAWLAHSYILDYHSIGHEKTLITFTNNQEIKLNISKGSFENQLNRTAQFRYILSNRILSTHGNNVKIIQ